MSHKNIAFITLLVICKIIYGNGEPPEKITGGTLTADYELPYIVSLMRYGQHTCGGAIISNQHILTAAHCVHNAFYPYSDLTVVSGTKSLIHGGEKHAVKQVTVHPSFIMSGAYSFPNDIAIIKLAQPMIFNSHQKSIQLPSFKVAENTNGIVAGWGFRTNVVKRPASSLSQVTVNILHANTCQKYMGNQLYFEQLCGIYYQGQGTCNGDSGGPLVANGAVVGVVSWGTELCGVGNPDIYTNVYSYLSFIRQHMT